MTDATELNRAYYGRLSAGRENYWALMPAPRMRIDAVVAAIAAERPDVKRICDFGCGNGALLEELLGRFPAARLHGIDLSAEQIRQNAARLPEMRFAPGDLTAEAFTYPFDSACDVAVSSEVIEHLDRPEAYLRNIYASLTDGGLLVITTQSGPVHATERFVGHVRHWEPEDMSAALVAAGFRDAAVRNCGFPFHDLSKWAANLRPNLTVRRFGDEEWGPAERGIAAVLRLLFRFNSGRRGRQLVAIAHK